MSITCTENIRWRWETFLISDDDKPSRNRNAAFQIPSESRSDIMEAWDKAWEQLFASLDALTPEDFEKTIVIRGEERSTHDAILGQYGHTCEHVGEIIQSTKRAAGANWKTLLTVPEKK